VKRGTYRGCAIPVVRSLLILPTKDKLLHIPCSDFQPGEPLLYAVEAKS